MKANSASSGTIDMIFVQCNTKIENKGKTKKNTFFLVFWDLRNHLIVFQKQLGAKIFIVLDIMFTLSV